VAARRADYADELWIADMATAARGARELHYKEPAAVPALAVAAGCTVPAPQHRVAVADAHVHASR
jgi:hypothetical protein